MDQMSPPYQSEDIKSLASIMKQPCGLAVETESINDDTFHFLPLFIQTNTIELTPIVMN